MSRAVSRADSISHEYFLSEAGNLPPLTRDEEQDLGRRIARGDQEAIDKLVMHNIRFAALMARRMSSARVPSEDTLQDALFGLIVAARRFRPGHGKFNSYAKWQIMHYIQRSSIRQASPVTSPHHARLYYKKVTEYLDAGGYSRENFPSLKQICKDLKMSEPCVLSGLLIYSGHRRLNDPIPNASRSGVEGDIEYVDFIEEPTRADDGPTTNSDREYVEQIIESMPAGYAEILRHRFGFYGRDECSDGLDLVPYDVVKVKVGRDCSRENMRQQTNRAIDAARSHAARVSRNEYLERGGSFGA